MDVEWTLILWYLIGGQQEGAGADGIGRCACLPFCQVVGFGMNLSFRP